MRDTPTTLAQAWRLYQRTVLHPAPDNAHMLAYHVFHAGAAALFDLVVGALAHETEAKRHARLAVVEQELLAYRREAERLRRLQPTEVPHA